jgi:hypothetical protein
MKRELLSLLQERERNLGPLIVYHSESLPKTPESVIVSATAANRHVLHVRFFESDGNGRPKAVSGQLVDRAPS